MAIRIYSDNRNFWGSTTIIGGLPEVLLGLKKCTKTEDIFKNLKGAIQIRHHAEATCLYTPRIPLLSIRVERLLEV